MKILSLILLLVSAPAFSAGKLRNADIHTSAAIDYSKLGPLGSGSIVVGSGSSVATPQTVSGDATLSATGALTLGTVAVAKGGTGQTSYTNGQILIGNSTGNTLAKSTITAGTGISVTNGAGTITIATTGTSTMATYSAYLSVAGSTCPVNSEGGADWINGTPSSSGNICTITLNAVYSAAPNCICGTKRPTAAARGCLTETSGSGPYTVTALPIDSSAGTVSGADFYLICNGPS